MQITTKSRYALRALVDIAVHQGEAGTPVRRVDIGAREDFSQDYLEQLLGKLRDAGIVEAVRGPGGGYRLIRKPEDIILWEVIRIVETNATLTPCADFRDHPECARFETCPTKNLWRYLQRRMEIELTALTLANILEDRYPKLD